MSFSFDPAATGGEPLAICRVRNHLNDVGNGSDSGGQEGRDYFLSDERIRVFLLGEAGRAGDEADVARLAAAAALDALATNEAYVQKVQSTLGLETNGARTAEAIRAHADSLRHQVRLAQDRHEAGGPHSSGGGSFTVVMQRPQALHCLAEVGA